jgi:hypothetical protein
MSQLNLLPDVKLQFIKTQRLRRTVGVLSVLVAGALLAVFVLLLLYVRVAQKQHINALDKDIDTAVATLQENTDLDKVLTIQNQLNSLPALHQQKVVSSRLADYLAKLTPNKATISSVEVDFEASTISLQGNADALKTVNKFIDTIKFTKYTTNTEGAAPANAFSDVVLQNFTVSTSSEGSENSSPSTYEIALNFDPAIFAGISNEEKADPAKPDIQLQIPKIISTRSEVESPNELFVPQPQDNNGQAGEEQ